MKDSTIQSKDTSATGSASTTELRLRQYEVLFEMITQLLATTSVKERMQLALEAITNDLEYVHAAIALIDERAAALKITMALGFEDNAAAERIQIPLDSVATGVSIVHTGQPAWITRGGTEWAPFIGTLAQDTDILALPLFGGDSDLGNPDPDIARRYPGGSRYWAPQSACIGAVYIGADQAQVDSQAMTLLLRLADLLGVVLGSAIRSEKLGARLNKFGRERQWVESIMKSAADPIVLTNLDNEILLQNRRAEELFSGSANASEGKRRALKLNDLLFSAYLSGATVSLTESVGQELTLVDPIEGTDIHFEVISTPALDAKGERLGLVSVFRDVTDLRRVNEELARNLTRIQKAEAEARRERDRLDLIIDNVGHPVVVTNAGGNFILFNTRAEALFGRWDTSTRHEQLLMSASDPSSERMLAAVTANSVKLTSFISGLASYTTSGRHAEIDMIEPESGNLLPMEITSVEVMDQKGQVTAVVSILHDLSQIRELERRRVEQQLFESEKLAAVGRLAASIAHEVNNPLEAIKNSLFLLQTSDDEASIDRFLNIARKETERVSHIIRQMLGFARKSGGVEWVDVNQLVEETLVLLEKKMKQGGISLISHLDPGLPVVRARPDQLRQVFLNVLLNAQQSIERSGEVKVRTSRYVSAVQPSISIEVSDTGPGISEEDKARIFEPFFSTRRKGTGLGLWVTQDIVHQHGGKIEITSPEGRGTTFQIILPVESPVLEGDAA